VRLIFHLTVSSHVTRAVIDTFTTLQPKTFSFVANGNCFARLRINTLPASAVIMHQSIPAVPIPPGQPRGICSSCQSRGWDIRYFIAARGLDICVPRGDPQAFDTRVFESAIDEFSGKDEAFVEQWLVRQGLEKLVDVF